MRKNLLMNEDELGSGRWRTICITLPRMLVGPGASRRVDHDCLVASQVHLEDSADFFSYTESQHQIACLVGRFGRCENQIFSRLPQGPLPIALCEILMQDGILTHPFDAV